MEEKCLCSLYMKVLWNMELSVPKYPFEVSLNVILQDPESYVDAVFSCLESEFLVLPKGAGFVEYPVFERGYGEGVNP